MIEALRSALRQHAPTLATAPLAALPDLGLAHAHVRLEGTGVLARLPKQSQVGLPPLEHLAFEAACFERAAPGGHAPRLLGLLPPSPALPRGGLLVEHIAGRPARLPQDLPALARALASLHGLPLPPPVRRAPLPDPPDTLLALRELIAEQALQLDAAGIEPAARVLIDHELARFDTLCRATPRPPRQLIAFDAHPGNFVIEPGGRAVLVDLEKARYGPAALDLAHATLHTSTTWDLASHAELTPAQVLGFLRSWEEAVGPAQAAAQRPWLVPLRRAMWLWSVTWCASWRVGSAQPAARGDAAPRSDDALLHHVAGRVDSYLSAPVVRAVCEEAELLDSALAPEVSAAR